MPLTLRRRVLTQYNPVSSGVVVNSEDFSVFGVVTDYNTYHVNGTSILAGDRKVLIAAESLSVEPSLDDELIIGTMVWKIISVRPTIFQSTAVVYEIQVRQNG